MSPYLAMSACSGVFPSESGSLISSRRPWSSSSFAVHSVSLTVFLPSRNTCVILRSASEKAA